VSFKKEGDMDVKIDKEVCTGCGLCVDTAPDVFEMENDTAKVKTVDIPESALESVREAASNCPVEAITLKE
jgi:ferredoxin